MSRLKTSYRSAWETYSGQKYFTIEQANRSLVLVKRIVAELRGNYIELTDMQEAIEAAERHGTQSQSEAACDRMEEVVDRIKDCLDELKSIGVVLTDFQRGVVDFPARVDGKEVCFCWQYGDECVKYWHEIDEGFADRQSLHLLSEQELPAELF